METDSTERESRDTRLNQQNILILSDSPENKGVSYSYTQTIASFFKKNIITCDSHTAKNANDFATLCDEKDIVFVVFSLEHSKNLKRTLKQYLRLSRELRVPYLFSKNYSKQTGTINSILAPITFLPEEKEKAPWATHFGKYGNCTTHLLSPNDNGNRAKRNVTFAEKLLSAEKCKFETHYGKRASYKNWKEILKYSKLLNTSLIVYSASREYSLDDIFFGPYEQKLIIQSEVPVLLINPRDDLYVLCGE